MLSCYCQGGWRGGDVSGQPKHPLNTPLQGQLGPGPGAWEQGQVGPGLYTGVAGEGVNYKTKTLLAVWPNWYRWRSEVV